MADGRFTSQGSRAEDLLKTQTVGLVHLDDFRKRRAEAIEQSERDHESQSQTQSGAATPSERSSTPLPQAALKAAKKKKRKVGKGKLSFAVNGGDDDDDEDEDSGVPSGNPSKPTTPIPSSTQDDEAITSRLQAKVTAAPRDDEEKDEEHFAVKRRLGPNASIANAPKVMTKSALQKEAREREQLRKEFLAMQEEVKATEVVLPFVFHGGSNIPGGSCRIRKGDPVWLFLDKCRKLGAELAVGGSGEARGRREWARVGVDDLMLVRKEIIIPHHYDFYYFIVNKTIGYDSQPLFAFSSKPTEATRSIQAEIDAGTYNPLSRPGQGHDASSKSDSGLEGSDDDPNATKVVNRQWYERNKHIFPASTWVEFDPAKDYTKETRRDAQGNSYFFS